MRKTWQRYRFVTAVAALILLQPSCGKKSGQTPVVGNNSPAVEEEPSDEAPLVTVNGSVRDERIEFVQAGESVQIGGVNLTRSQRVLSIDVLSDEGTWSPWGEPVALTSTSFSVQVPSGSWYRLSDSQSELALTLQAIPQSLAKESAVVLHVALNQTTTVASRIFDQVALRSSTDAVAARLIRERALPVASLTALAAALVSGTERGAGGIDLNQVAARFVVQADTTRQALAAVSVEDWTRTLASSSLATLYGEAAAASSIATASNTAMMAFAGSMTAGGYLTAESAFVDVHPGLRTVADLANEAPTVAVAMGASVVLAASQYETWVGSGSMPPVTEESVSQKTETMAAEAAWTSAPQSQLITVVDALEPPPPSSQVIVPSSSSTLVSSSSTTTSGVGSGSSTTGSTWLTPASTTTSTTTPSSSTTSSTMGSSTTTSSTMVSAPDP